MNEQPQFDIVGHRCGIMNALKYADDFPEDQKKALLNAHDRIMEIVRENPQVGFIAVGIILSEIHITQVARAKAKYDAAVEANKIAVALDKNKNTADSGGVE